MRAAQHIRAGLLTLEPSGPWVPTDDAEFTTKVFGWWDPSDSDTVSLSGGGSGSPASVTQIDDKSVNARHLTAVGTGSTIGAINGLDAVQSANSASNYMRYAASVAAVTDMISVHSSGGDTAFIQAAIGVSPFFGAAADGSAASPHSAGSPAYRADGDALTSPTRADVYTAWSGDHIAHTAALSLSGWTSLGVYYYGGGGGFQFAGLWGDVILMTAAPSTALRQKLEGYLAHRWGMEGNLDAGHPYKASPP